MRSSDYITAQAEGKNLVDGEPAWTHVESKKHDLDYMHRCCEAELETMASAGFVAAPYFFQRTAVLLRKAGQYRREVEICERYLAAVERFYADKDMSEYADVRQGPTFKAIETRLTKARALAI